MCCAYFLAQKNSVRTDDYFLPVPLVRIVKEYAEYFNQERPHQGIEQRISDQYDLTAIPVREQERINYPNVCAGWLTKVIFLAKSHKQP